MHIRTVMAMAVAILPLFAIAQNTQLRKEPWVKIEPSSPEGPSVKGKYSKYASEAAIPLANLTDESFDDLQFLKTEIGDSRVVMLGSSHDKVEEYEQVKLRLVRFLHSQMGFEIVATMSDMRLIRAQDGLASTAMLRQMMTDNSSQTLSYLKLANYMKANDEIRIVGLGTCPYDPFFADNMEEWLLELDLSLGDELYTADHTLHEMTLGNVSTEKISVARKAFEKASAAVPEAAKELTYDQRILLQRLFRERLILLNQLENSPDKTAACEKYKSEMVAKNINWLAGEVYPNKKIIVLGGNDMMAKESGAIIPKLSSALQNEIYALSMYAYEGVVGGENGAAETLPAREANSIEAVMRSTRYKYAFVNVTKALEKRNDWLETSTAGTVPAKNFDGLLYINEVSASKPIFNAKGR